jgi:hypothetical protein
MRESVMSKTERVGRNLVGFGASVIGFLKVIRVVKMTTVIILLIFSGYYFAHFLWLSCSFFGIW